MKNYNRQIGAWLAYQRKAHNMSQDDVAEMRFLDGYETLKTV